MVRSFVWLLAVAIGLLVPASARADSLFDLLKASNKVLACSTQVLKDDSVLTIGMPKKHGDFLVVNGPLEHQAFPTFVVYPNPRWPLKLTAAKFRKMSSLTMKVRDVTGIYRIVERAFVLTGAYQIVVGSGFDTPNPVVDGWCEVNYERTEPFRDREGPDLQPNQQDLAWNKMKCSPSVLTEKSVLKIELPFPHGGYLSVFFRGSFEYLVYPHAAPGWALYDSGDYERMRSISLRVVDVKLRTQQGFKRIFVKPGQYLISVGDTFESDGPLYHGWCRVTYRPQGRS